VIRILLVEDARLIRAALSALIEREQDMEVVAELDRGDAILRPRSRWGPMSPSSTSTCRGWTG
jgi:two-component system, NarL family, response regulator DesR